MRLNLNLGANELAYITTAGSSQRRRLLFLHGFMGRAEDWLPMLTGLQAEYACLAVDLPGHGQTRIQDGQAHYRMENCAAMLIAFLQELNWTPCTLVGYSMGGRLALYLALRYPQFFRALILESASPGLQTAEQRAQRIAEDEARAAQLTSGDYADFLQNWLQLPLFANMNQKPGFEALYQRRLQNDPAGLALSLRQMGAGQQPSLWADLPSLAMPALLLAGAKDAKFIALNKEMAKACPAAQFRMIENAGHNIHFEAPASYLEHIRTFLKDHKETDDELN